MGTRWVAKIGSYHISEQFRVVLDAKEYSDWFRVFGPGADTERRFNTLAEAIQYAEELKVRFASF